MYSLFLSTKLSINSTTTYLYSIISVTIHWKHKSGEIKTTTAKVGMNLLQAARLKDIDLEGKFKTTEFCLHVEYLILEMMQGRVRECVLAQHVI